MKKLILTGALSLIALLSAGNAQAHDYKNNRNSYTAQHHAPQNWNQKYKGHDHHNNDRHNGYRHYDDHHRHYDDRHTKVIYYKSHHDLISFIFSSR